MNAPATIAPTLAAGDRVKVTTHHFFLSGQEGVVAPAQPYPRMTVVRLDSGTSELIPAVWLEKLEPTP